MVMHHQAEGDWRRSTASWLFPACLLLCCLAPAVCLGNWYDAAFPLRRALDLIAVPERINGEETAVAEFYAPGLAGPDGADLRIAAEDGKPVPMRLLQAGPGDRVRVLFNPARGQIRHYAYWGNAGKKLPPPKPAAQNAGLIVETKRFAGGELNTVAKLARAWEASGPVVGVGVIDRLHWGFEPSEITPPSISRITGTLYSPADGEYQLAASMDDRGGIRLDGRDFLLVPGFPADSRFNKTIRLARGPHPLEIFHVNHQSDWRATAGWKRPDSPRMETIAADFFGRLVRTKAGTLEQHRRQTVADVQVTHAGECILAERSSYRLRLETPLPPAGRNIRVAWDFGDGQTATGPAVEHVFLAPGVYPVTVTLKSTQADDKRTVRILVGRDPLRMTDPHLDESIVQAPIVAAYDAATLPPAQLAQATRICIRAKQKEAMFRMLKSLCRIQKHPEQQLAVDVIAEAIEAADEQDEAGRLADALSTLTPRSNLHPKAAALHAHVLLWRVADFDAACEMLQPFAERESPNLKRLYLTALLLAQRPAEARAVLTQMRDDEEGTRRVALSGALARSVEFFIDQKDLPAAEEQWDDWQRRFPSTLFDGYAALLRARILGPRYPAQAARVAEAFALALPDSPYAPQLLDFAARSIEPTDRDKSAALRSVLRQKYPEDPLSQN